MNWCRSAALLGAAFLLLGGCAGMKRPAAPTTVSVEVPEQPEWVGIATPADEDRLARLGKAWEDGLAEARRRGFSRAIRAEGELLDPAAGLTHPAPTPGSYHCRVFRLGKPKRRGPAFTAFKPYFCHIESEGPSLLSFTKQTGSQRPAGWLYPDGDPKRLIFLGTLVRDNERTPLAYGDDPDRDMIGVVERVAPYRFRLVIPWSRDDSTIDVIELVPAP